MDALVVTANVLIPASDLAWSASRASGPGGQNVNKVASKVDLRFDLPGTSALDGPTKARLRAQCASRLDADGWLVVVAQATRDQARNLELAREKLRELVVRALTVPKKRRATRPSKRAVQRRLDAKHRQSEKKAGRKTERSE